MLGHNIMGVFDNLWRGKRGRKAIDVEAKAQVWFSKDE